MDLVLTLVALCAVLLTIRLVRSRRRRLEALAELDAGRTSSDVAGRTVSGPEAARGRGNQHSWLLGGGRSGG
ncbi:hypothetical protein [Modestobacter sp. URMC 112]